MKFLLLTAALFITAHAMATPLQLDEITVHADKTGIPLHLSNLNVEIIEVDNNSVSLQDALEQSGSIDINQMHGQDGTTVSLNGMGSRHVLITLDGLALNPSGQSVNLNDINMGNIERIEVLKGNASSQYGSQALGGVINLVSKPVQETSLPSVSIHYAKTAQHTSILGDSSANINYSQVLDNFKLSHNFQANQYSQSQLDDSNTNAEHSSGYRLLFNEKIIYNDLIASSQINIKRLERPFDYQITNNVIKKNKIENEDRGFLQLNYAPDAYQASAKYQYFKTQSIQDVIASENPNDLKREIKSHFFQADIQSNFDINNQTITYGAFTHAESMSEIKSENYISSDELGGTQSKSSIEFFVLHDWYVNDVLNIQSGLRTQFDSDFGIFNSPNIAMRWDINSQNIIKASTGIGYRVPDLKERFYEFDHSLYGYEVIGNENLAPETSLSSQIQWQFSNEDFSLSNSIYSHFLEDLIEQQIDASINNGIDSYVNINNGRATIIGLDSQLKWTGHSHFEWSIAANILDAKYLNDQTDMVNKPNKTIKTKATWNFANNKALSSQISWQGDAINSEQTNKPDVFLLNINWQQTLTKDLELNLALNNATNQIKDPDFLEDSRPDTGLELAVHLSYTP